MEVFFIHISLKFLHENYKQLKKYTKKEIKYSDWKECNNLAYQLQDLHSFNGIGENMSKWADRYFIEPFVKNKLAF